MKIDEIIEFAGESIAGLREWMDSPSGAELFALLRRDRKRKAWREYARAALIGCASRPQTIDNQGPAYWAEYAAEAADAMLALESKSFPMPAKEPA